MERKMLTRLKIVFTNNENMGKVIAFDSHPFGNIQTEIKQEIVS